MAIVIQPFSPVAFSIFGLDIRWYALAYVAAFVAGYFMIRRMAASPNSAVKLSHKQIDDLFSYVILGVIIGGRLGYVLFYNLSYFLAHPLQIFALWHGGMSFHGGLVGVILSVFMFARRRKINPWQILDIMAVVAPIGLLFGRIANFINMEVMGRPTNVPWAIVFAGDINVPRHPSPLYEATAEGIILFAVMACLYRFTNLRKYAGALGGLFGVGYAVARIICEQFRAPDVQIGFLTSWGLTMGQMLSGLMLVAGAIIFAIAMRKKLL